MDTNTLIILLGIATLFVTTIGIGIAVILYLSKKIDDLNDRMIKLEINTNNQIKDISTNLYLINDKLGILGFSNKSTNGVHKKEEQPAELELQ